MSNGECSLAHTTCPTQLRAFQLQWADPGQVPSAWRRGEVIGAQSLFHKEKARAPAFTPTLCCSAAQTAGKEHIPK